MAAGHCGSERGRQQLLLPMIRSGERSALLLGWAALGDEPEGKGVDDDRRLAILLHLLRQPLLCLTISGAIAVADTERSCWRNGSFH